MSFYDKVNEKAKIVFKSSKAMQRVVAWFQTRFLYPGGLMHLGKSFVDVVGE